MTRWRIALWSAGAFAALAVLVHLGYLNGLDTLVRNWARPNDVWGTAQLRADLVVEGLRPVIMAVLLMTFTLACCAKRRSLTPAAFVGAVGALTVALTVGSKIIVGRLDTHGVIGANGGSFPSGHVIGVVVCVGIVIMILEPRTGRWIWLIPAAGGVLMGTCLLLQAAHWFTDILGGALLATAVLAAASALIDWLPNRSGNDHDSAVPEQRNGPSLTRVGESSRWIARLSNAVPDIGLADCYDPDRGKFVPRSCGGL